MPSLSLTSRARRLPAGRAARDMSVWRLGGVIVFGAFTSQLDTSVVNVGLDSIGRELHASLGEVQWVANAYLLALAVGLPLTGWLGRRVGVGRLWLAALAAFTVASALCALAPDAESLIALRVVQGLTAGLLVPAGQTVLGQAAGPERLGRVMGVLGLAVSLAPAIGPVVGALVLEVASWRWLFLINVPIGLVGLVLGLRTVPRGTRGAAPPLDLLGLALVGAGLPAAVYGLTRVADTATIADPVAAATVAGGVLALLGYLAHARRTEHPLLDLRLYRVPAYAAGSVTALLTGTALFGAALLFPLYFQLGRDADVLDTGLSLITLGAGTALMSPVSGTLTDRFGGGIVAVGGIVLTVASTVPFALLPTDAGAATLQPLLFVRGMAIALAMTPVITAVYAAVRPEALPDATTQLNIVMRLGGALGGALLAVVVADELPAGAEHAFHTAFWWLTASSLLALVPALLLWRATAVPQSNPRKEHRG